MFNYINQTCTLSFLIRLGKTKPNHFLSWDWLREIKAGSGSEEWIFSSFFFGFSDLIFHLWSLLVVLKG